MSAPLRPLSTLGTGSVPFQEGKNSCEEIFETWDIPFWPQYPVRSLRENFVFQFLSGFPGLRFSESEVLFDEKEFFEKNPARQKKLRQAFFDKDFSGFEPPRDFALGYFQMKEILEKKNPEKRLIKLQITGPATVWKSFFSERVSKNHADGIYALLLQTLIAAGLAQIQRIRFCQRTAMILIDEPLGFEKMENLIEMGRAFKNSGSIVGLHNCSKIRWENLEDLEMDVLHFDATQAFKEEDPRIPALQSWIKKGKWVAWGLIPTFPNPDFEVRDFSPLLLEHCARLSDKTLSMESILERSLISTACGMGTLGLAQAEKARQSARITAQNLEVFRERNKDTQKVRVIPTN